MEPVWTKESQWKPFSETPFVCEFSDSMIEITARIEGVAFAIGICGLLGGLGAVANYCGAYFFQASLLTPAITLAVGALCFVVIATVAVAQRYLIDPEVERVKKSVEGWSSKTVLVGEKTTLGTRLKKPHHNLSEFMDSVNRTEIWVHRSLEAIEYLRLCSHLCPTKIESYPIIQKIEGNFDSLDAKIVYLAQIAKPEYDDGSPGGGQIALVDRAEILSAAQTIRAEHVVADRFR